MKRDTLIRVIDEEFGDSQPFSWLIDLFIKSVEKNDRRVKECTNQYEEQVKKVNDYLEELKDELLVMEKEESQSIRVTHKRKVNNKPFDSNQIGE